MQPKYVLKYHTFLWSYCLKQSIKRVLERLSNVRVNNIISIFLVHLYIIMYISEIPPLNIEESEREAFPN